MPLLPLMHNIRTSSYLVNRVAHLSKKEPRNCLQYPLPVYTFGPSHCKRNRYKCNMQNQYSLRSPAVKRLMKEAQEFREPTEQFFAQPLEDNLFEWHFTIRGPGDSEFDGGVYHGRIVLPPDYPMKPPSIILLTPNGRFECNTKICLSISGHHPESWQPSWSIRTALLAIIGFMPTHGNGAIGSLDYTPEERKVLAKRSRDWKCKECGSIKNILPPVTEASKETSKEAKELASQISFKGEKKSENKDKDEGEKTETSEATPQSAPGTQQQQQTSPQMPPNFNPFMQGFPNMQGFPAMPGFPPFNPAMFPGGFPQQRPGGPQQFWPPPPQMMAMFQAAAANNPQMFGSLMQQQSAALNQQQTAAASQQPPTATNQKQSTSKTQQASSTTQLSQEAGNSQKQSSADSKLSSSQSSASTSGATSTNNAKSVTSASSIAPQSTPSTSSNSASPMTSSSTGAGASSSVSQSSTTSSSISSTTTTTTSTSSSANVNTVRQRVNAARISATPQAPLTTPAQPQQNTSTSYLTVGTICVLAFLLIALIIRRLAMLRQSDFDLGL